MKNKITTITLVLSLFISFPAFAQQKQKNGENFAKNKARNIFYFNQLKSVIEIAISCLNSAQNIESVKKCYYEMDLSSRRIEEEMKKGK